jgi:hypothetical protein
VRGACVRLSTGSRRESGAKVVQRQLHCKPVVFIEKDGVETKHMQTLRRGLELCDSPCPVLVVCF